MVLGVLGAGGWWMALGAPPDEPEPEVEAVLAPTPAESTKSVDEAMAAVAALAGSGSIRCELKGLGAGGADARWPFSRADWDGQVLRAVVPSPAGTRVVFGPHAGADPEAVLAGEDAVPVGLVTWSGATRGAVGGCTLTPTKERALHGKVTGPDGPVGGVQVQVCGDRVQAGADGTFTGTGWVGDRCIVYVSEPGWTRGLISLEVGRSPEPELRVERSSADTSRRVVVRGELPAVRALQDPDLSPGARDVLRGWAQDGLKAKETRRQLASEVEALTAPPEAPSVP